MKAQTPNAVAILCAYRDELIVQANNLLNEAQEQLNVAKSHFHDVKIKHNQLIKQSEMVQECISDEMQAAHNERLRVEREYSVKSDTEMSEQIK